MHPMFTVALFLITQTCHLMDKWIIKMWYTHTQWNIIQP